MRDLFVHQDRQRLTSFYASDDFVRVVKDLSGLCGAQIGAVHLSLENQKSEAP